MTSPGPSPTELETILTIGARVPDHGKLAPWRFIIFEGDARARAGEVIAGVFAKKSECLAGRYRDREAPPHRRAAGDRRRQPHQTASQGAAVGTGDVRRRERNEIVTAATALGYGACWLSGWFSFDRDVLDGLGLKADEKLAGLIHIGKVSKPSEDRPRPVLSDIVTRF